MDPKRDLDEQFLLNIILTILIAFTRVTTEIFSVALFSTAELKTIDKHHKNGNKYQQILFHYIIKLICDDGKGFISVTLSQ